MIDDVLDITMVVLGTAGMVTFLYTTVALWINERNYAAELARIRRGPGGVLEPAPVPIVLVEYAPDSRPISTGPVGYRTPLRAPPKVDR